MSPPPKTPEPVVKKLVVSDTGTDIASIDFTKLPRLLRKKGELTVRGIHEEVFGPLPEHVSELDLENRKRGIMALDSMRDPERMLGIAMNWDRFMKNRREAREFSSIIGHEPRGRDDFFKSLKYRLSRAIQISEKEGLRHIRPDESHPVLVEFDQALDTINVQLGEASKIVVEFSVPCAINPPHKVVFGRSWWFDERVPVDKSRHLTDEEVPLELAKLDALEKKLKERERELGRSPLPKMAKDMLTSAYLMALDPEMGSIKEARKIVAKDKHNALWAIEEATENLQKAFLAMGPGVAKLADDVTAGGKLAITELFHGKTPDEFAEQTIGVMPPNTVLLTKDVSYTMAYTMLGHPHISGTVVSNPVALTRHLGTIAKERRAVVVCVEGLENLKFETGDDAIVDTFSRDPKVVFNPRESTRKHYVRIRDNVNLVESEKIREAPLEAVTKDGFKIQLAANIGRAEDVDMALLHGARGSGLVRTCEGILTMKKLPSMLELEEIFVKQYGGIAGPMAENGHSTYLRALDLGLDKIPHAVAPLFEGKDSFTFRGIRVLLENPDLFKAQIRAVLRTAGQYPKTQFFLPMVDFPEQIKASRDLIKESERELEARGVPNFRRDIPLGSMVETIQAVMNVRDLAKVCDFFSIGWNDLTQETLRLSLEQFKAGYHDHDPRVIKHAKQIIDGVPESWRQSEKAAEAPTRLSVCGEIAGTTTGAIIAMGLGYQKLSMVPDSIPLVKRVIRDGMMSTFQTIANEVLVLKTPDEVIEHVRHRMEELDGVSLTSDKYVK